MGVKGLIQLISQQAPAAIVTLPTSHFEGKRIAVDTHFQMYAFRSIAKKDVVKKHLDTIHIEDPPEEEIDVVWLKMIVRFANDMKCKGITINSVFDSDIKLYKADCHKMRGKDKKRKENILANTRKAIEENPLLLNEAAILILQTEINGINKLPRESLVKCKTLLKAMGVPVLTSKEEGESLCSMMNREKIVAAVYTKDGDTLLLGSPLVIIERGDPMLDVDQQLKTSFNCVRYDKIIEGLELNHEEFVDLGIMQGTDFSHNIPGIGPARALKNIKTYGRIHKLPCSIDIKTLNHVEARAQFKTRKAYSLCEDADKAVFDYQPIDTDYLDHVLETLGIRDMYDEILQCDNCLKYYDLTDTSGLLDDMKNVDILGWYYGNTLESIPMEIVDAIENDGVPIESEEAEALIKTHYRGGMWISHPNN